MLREGARAGAIRSAIEAGDPSAAPLDEAQQASMVYARKQNVAPAEMVQTDVQLLREEG
ncbi:MULTISPECIES: hypothetical protein [Arthrobacter]|uniref:hypothetical protein n=1 Tax=Arthrobacter TaxID=1663 RepID=UPI0014735AFD|nr:MULTISPECIES: hypothetical protein [Arthrobacter]NYG16150.1 hypothetical protein [Arthrobacter psychrochitiniphilus]